MSDLLLSEELLLLALDAEKGRDRTSWRADPGLAGARRPRRGAHPSA
jgi:hypothetical protein